MKLNKLYIDNFMCYEFGYIDFSQFSSALIVGKIENNELYSNGVGKTTIFKAIEYVLFNQADVNLETIIRDNANNCKITVDFTVNDQEYRLIRTRTKKGSTDLSLFERTAAVASDEKVYHIIKNHLNDDLYIPITEEKYWKNISGRRASDTEKDLSKLIKINFKSFRSTVHFMQNDFSGLTTATPEKRKGILKDALNLVIYSKLEKMTKDKISALSKEIDKYKILFENLGDPIKDLSEFSNQLLNVNNDLIVKNNIVVDYNNKLSIINDVLSKLMGEYTGLSAKYDSLINKENTLNFEKNKIEISVKEYISKKNNVIKSANELVIELKSLKDLQTKLISLDYTQIDILNEDISFKKDIVAQNNVSIKNNIELLEELKIPLPDNSICKHCRQPLSEDHKKICQQQINIDITNCQNNILISKKKVAELNSIIAYNQQAINNLLASKQQLENINNKITSKSKEISDKKILHQEYSVLLEKFQNEVKLKNEEIVLIQNEISLISLQETDFIKNKIDLEKEKSIEINTKLSLLNKEINHLNNTKAVLQHNIEVKNKDKIKKEDLNKIIKESETKIAIYPLVLQGFSSTGMPNLIIQDVLDDLQIEANKLLIQIKPGLQLSFFIEKTKGDGTEADTLDINYQINGKSRYYEQLSGAQKLAVTFSLKLGLSFLLQQRVGTDIKFLLLDEIDQSLDKASVDAFADIVKLFQKDFTILIVTHNDRLKDKFSHAVLVEQDINMVSRAKVVSSW